MNDLQTGLNMILNVVSLIWGYATSASVPLVARMVFLAPLVAAIVGLIKLVFGGSLGSNSL